MQLIAIWIRTWKYSGSCDIANGQWRAWGPWISLSNIWCNHRECYALGGNAIWRVAVMIIEFCTHHSSCQKMISGHLNRARLLSYFAFAPVKLWTFSSTSLIQINLQMNFDCEPTDAVHSSQMPFQEVFRAEGFITFCANIFDWYLLCFVYTQVRSQRYQCCTLSLADTTSTWQF